MSENCDLSGIHQDFHFEKDPELAKLVQDLSGANPLRYYHLQDKLIDIFKKLPSNEEKEAAYFMLSYLSQYLWEFWFDHKFPIQPRTLIKTLDETSEQMMEELMYADVIEEMEKEKQKENDDAVLYCEDDVKE